MLGQIMPFQVRDDVIGANGTLDTGAGDVEGRMIRKLSRGAVRTLPQSARVCGFGPGPDRV